MIRVFLGIAISTDRGVRENVSETPCSIRQNKSISALRSVGSSHGTAPPPPASEGGARPPCASGTHAKRDPRQLLAALRAPGPPCPSHGSALALRKDAEGVGRGALLRG